MKSQSEMLVFLTKNINSHEFSLKDNKIYGKRLINYRSFKSFTITFLKNVNGIVSLAVGNTTSRYNDENKLIKALGSIAVYNIE